MENSKFIAKKSFFGRLPGLNKIRQKKTRNVLPRTLLLFMSLVLTSLSMAETKSDVSLKFRNAGCQDYKISKVAELHGEGVRIYVAWCSGATNYLMVMKCGFGYCKLMK